VGFHGSQQLGFLHSHLHFVAVFVFASVFCFWVAQRFTPAITGVSSVTALAAEVALSAGELVSPQPVTGASRGFPHIMAGARKDVE
jgi:hypothetical protein